LIHHQARWLAQQHDYPTRKPKHKPSSVGFGSGLAWACLAPGPGFAALGLVLVIFEPPGLQTFLWELNGQTCQGIHNSRLQRFMGFLQLLWISLIHDQARWLAQPHDYPTRKPKRKPSSYFFKQTLLGNFICWCSHMTTQHANRNVNLHQDFKNTPRFVISLLWVDRGGLFVSRASWFYRAY
jgi:hypothetical protein